MHKKFFNFAYVMTFLWQILFSFAAPLGILWAVGYWLHHSIGVGKWALILCIILGALFGVYSMFHYIITMVDWASAEDRNSSVDPKKDNKK